MSEASSNLQAQLYMDPKLQKAISQGNMKLLKHLLAADPKVLLTKTPQQNTALHIAARLGRRRFAEAILQESDTILIEKNIDGDTPLHMAARFGRVEVADLLINLSLQWPFDIDLEEGSPITVRNEKGNTPLHEAVTYGKAKLALMLLEANPYLGHMLNKKQESPFHIAMRGDMAIVVEYSWIIAKDRQTTGTPFHQAALGGHIKILEMLLRLREDLVKHVDSKGNNALHYAAQRDNAGVVKMLLVKDRSLAYGNNDDGQTPLHVAVQYGSKSAIKTILKYCPDTAEQCGPDGENALHIAVSRAEVSSLKCLLKHIQSEEVINHQDSYGDTPLHLAAKLSRTEISFLLLKDKRVDPCLLNKKGQTARSAIETNEANEYKVSIWRELKKQEAKRCRNNVQLPLEQKMKSNEYFELCVQTYTVVAALIATVTFSAVFTMPGGYDQTRGFAILARKPAFIPFIISNTIAMCSALVVVFCFIWAWRDPVKFRLSQLKWFHRLTVVACLSLIVSLMTAVYLVVVPELRWLSIVVILIGCSVPVMVWLILGPEVLHMPSL